LKTSRVTPADLRRSVIAVPPMARHPNGSVHAEENVRLLNHLRGGGVTTFLYAGNANFYNLGASELGRTLDALVPLLAEGEWLIPSIGPGFGKAAEQVALVRERAFPTALVLPPGFPTRPAGVARGLGKLASLYGKPLIAYLKDDGYIDHADLAALLQEGSLSAVQYGVRRKSPADDPVLQDLVRRMGPDLIISGMGERGAPEHFRRFGLRAFASGAACLAPALSSRLREALQAGDEPTAVATRELFLAFEAARDTHSPVQVLHAAVELAGIAATGPVGEFLSNIDDEPLLRELGEIARILVTHDEAACGARGAAAHPPAAG
jgi:4-hydroxy-tetrahydrodipicolinate synthase